MAATTPNTMALNCSVCPKKPFFSDVSHLLTHIASKGHLSHYYKLKVKSAQDRAARDIIEQYNQWYADNNVEHLMSERMHSKERRRPRRRESAPIAKKPAAKPKRRQTIDGISPVKTEPLLDHTDHLTFAPLPNPFSFAPLRPKSHKPRLFLWDTKRPASFDAISLESSPETSPLRMMFPRAMPFAPMRGQTPIIDEEGEEEITEVTRLKGVFWPGMDIFDAATPLTKRRRNQKKDTSVAESLERNALLVEPNEVIFTPYGTLKKSRYITGQIEYDSSPYKLDIPTPQPKRKQARKALADKSTNIPIGHTHQLSLPPFRGFSPLRNNPAQQTSLLAVEPRTKKRKRGFQVFEDRDLGMPVPPPAQRLRPNDERSFSNPGGMHLLTSAFTQAPIFDADPQRAGHAADSGNAQPCSTYFADAFGHYQPAFYGMPYYGYSYYGPTQYNMTGFMPLQAQQPINTKRENVNELHHPTADTDSRHSADLNEEDDFDRCMQGDDTESRASAISNTLDDTIDFKPAGPSHDDSNTISAANSDFD